MSRPRPLSINAKLPPVIIPANYSFCRQVYFGIVVFLLISASLALWRRQQNTSISSSFQPVDPSQRAIYNTLYDAVKISAKNRFCPPIGHGLHYDRYNYLFSESASDVPRRYFIAVNLYNNADVLPDMIMQLLDFINVVGSRNVFVSVYENGSNDGTKMILRMFSELLKTIGTPFRLHVSFNRKKTDIHRIEYMAEVRNRVLQSLYDDKGRSVRYANGTWGTQYFDQVLFLNDVYFCASDILELVHQQLFQQSHMACGLDFDVDKTKTLGFYDTWVARDVDGREFKKRPLNGFVPHGESNQRLAKELPFEVYSCWNGVAAMDARPFLSPFNLRFRRVKTVKVDPQPSGIKKPLYKTCSASECKTICRDLHDAGFHRIIVVPSVRVSYEWEWYLDIKILFPTMKDDKVVQTFHKPEEEKIRFLEEEGRFTKSVVCLPMERVGARSPDGLPGEELVGRPNIKTH